MSSLLYCSISSDLTKDEIIEIDKQIPKNRETVFSLQETWLQMQKTT